MPQYIMGGEGGTANENIVTITNSTVNLNSNNNDPYYNLTGGVAYSDVAKDNKVIITDLSLIHI